MTAIILTESALMAILPAGLLLFAILDRYAAPRVAESLFEERKVLIAFLVGIPGGLPLALVFLVYAGNLQDSALLAGLIYLFFFVAVANLGRMVFLKFKTFSGKGRQNRASPFYVLSFGCGNAVTVILAAANVSLPLSSGVDAIILLLLLSGAMALLEGWAGLRFASAHLKGGGFVPVAIGEAVALAALAPIYLGLTYVNLSLPAFLIAFLFYLLSREELRTLRPLLSSQREGAATKPFGRREEKTA